MNKIYIFDPTEKDTLSSFRGGGRIMQLLKENLADEAQFITDFQKISPNDTLLIPVFYPFQKPILSRRIAKKQVLMIYDVIPLKYPQHFPIGIKGTINLWLNKRALKNYDQIITISHHSKKDIIRYLNIPAKKIEVIYPTVCKVFLNPKHEYRNPKQFQKTNYSNPKQKDFNNLNLENLDLFRTSDFGFRASYCLYIGDVNWNKNLVNLARAIKIADVSCIFVGANFNKKLQVISYKLQKLTHPWQKEFQDFLQEIGDDPRFICAGYKTDEELINLYKQARLNILVSRDEGFGFSYLEASTLGCPSVLSDTDVFHETADAEATLFANPNNPKDIAIKIRQLFDNKKLREKITSRAQKRSQYFIQEIFKKAWEKILR